MRAGDKAPCQDAAGESSGFVCHARGLREGDLRIKGCELAGGVSWLEATPTVLRELAEICREGTSDEQALASLTFVLAERHPLEKPSRRYER